MGLPGTKRLDDPTIYYWQLTDKSSRYKNPRAWPSSETLHKEFTSLAAINALVAVVTLVFLIAFCSSKKVRSSAFNLYLFFVALPDFLSSFFCLITCAMSAVESEYYSERMCGFQAWYLYFAQSSNAWMNAIIAYQVHALLSNSNSRMRYRPPSRRQVCQHSAAVYLFAAAGGFINAFNIPGIPHEAHLYYGFACNGMEHDLASSIFFWLVFIPFYMGLPCCYASYVVWDIWKRNLLPPAGNRRNVALFLLRLCFIYFIVWFPFLLLSLIGNFIRLKSWQNWAGAAISHFQGIIGVIFCMSNQDIREAVWALVLCRVCCGRSLDNDATDMQSKQRSDVPDVEAIRRSGFFHWMGLRFGNQSATSRSGSSKFFTRAPDRDNPPSVGAIEFPPSTARSPDCPLESGNESNVENNNTHNDSESNVENANTHNASNHRKRPFSLSSAEIELEEESPEDEEHLNFEISSGGNEPEEKC